jgi:hypothetical protein
MKSLSSNADLEAIRRRISLVSPADTALWGSMSAPQMVCHLTDAFGCPLGERPVSPLKASPIPVPIYKWLALRFPRKWPAGGRTTPEMDQQLDQFAKARDPWTPHPMFGAMTTVEWMRWGYLHTDHHLRQFGR